MLHIVRFVIIHSDETIYRGINVIIIIWVFLKKILKDILEFWMDKGISGFRFDALKHLFENITFADEPYLKGKEGSLLYNDIDHIYIIDQPEVIEIIYDWREFLDNYTKTKNPLYPK